MIVIVNVGWCFCGNHETFLSWFVYEYYTFNWT